MLPRAGRSRTGVALLAALAAVAAILLLVGPAGVLFVAPSMAAVLTLAAGWFPGERVLATARARRHLTGPRSDLGTSVRRADAVLGRLLRPVAACAAGRAPPRPA